MEIKNVDNFTIEDCENFLSTNKNNVQDDLHKEVTSRYNQLISEKEKKQEDYRLRKQQEIDNLRKQTKWIDIDQFLENRKYFRLSKYRLLVFLVFIISFSLVTEICYYTNTSHKMYAGSLEEQVMQVEGLENILLSMQLIEMPDFAIDGTVFPCYAKYNYYLTKSVGTTITVCVISFILFLLISLFNSSIIRNIYNIQDGDKKNRFRAIENKNGKKGLCKAGHLKIKKILPFEYDDIFATYENSYVCCKRGKYGVYNTDLKKMTIPVIYDGIYSINPDNIVLILEKDRYSFTNKGYRLVK